MFYIKKDFNKVTPLDPLRDPYNALTYTGIYKLLNPSTSVHLVLHNLYRCFAFTLVSIYLIQHWTYIYKMYEASELQKLVEGAVLTLPHQIFLFKAYALAKHSSRLEKVHELLNGPVFAATSTKDQNLIYQQYSKMFFLFRMIHTLAAICGLFWVLNPFLKKFKGHEDDALITVFPFKTNSVPLFTFSALWDTIAFYPWLGVSHLSIDFIIANYFFCARVQLEILNTNLLVAFDNVRHGNDLKRVWSDEHSSDLRDNFVRLIKRYDKIVWFLQEICSVFNFPLSAHLLLSSGEICMAVYKLSVMSGFTTQHLFYILLTAVLQVQLLLYCYNGGLIQYESESINTALYKSDWWSVSPKFRKQLLIVMARWQRPLTPKVAFVVPLSLRTYLSIVKTAYSIYSILITKS